MRRAGSLRHAVFDLDTEPAGAGHAEAAYACGSAVAAGWLAEGGTQSRVQIGVIQIDRMHFDWSAGILGGPLA